ncbi:LUD domain-containing protein [Halopelagius longus]|uniref:4Fe-4S dicluster domain-containing protein n=1 Tax=Halopelagius longus TaxID=1236180 RepID=A0A1H1FF28_9EURY|nr:LUD domain-containing protein [Halopelagius longus]RDI70132.1 4Fe-4S dicluster domain-containing protein [Halopelagius longus]SDQ99521.1 iron-sulfur cluster-binding protein [Halopelagius longus]
MSARRERRRKAERIRHLLKTEGDAIRANTTVFNEDRYAVTADFDEYEGLRTEAREIKEDAIERLPELVERVRESVEANGGTVYVADDADDANEYIAGVVEDENAETVVKSKSMTTEELDVNEHLRARGTDVWETDLGEFVLQVAEEAPSHLVGPSLHKSKDDVARLFNEAFDPEEPFETAQELTEFARDYLGERIRDADVGMTGANFVLADSGTIALVTNEGNARKSAVTPDTHVAVAGVEKLIPGAEELQPFIELIAKAATGQPIAQYVTMLTPPVESPTIDFDAPDEPLGSADERDFHLVLVDNGRTEMREDDQLRETLYCIRCGACANSCANFQHVGGHAFGGETYTGGIATGWETGVHGIDSADDFNDLCTGCTRCVDACPVKIDVPWINTVVRDRRNQGADPSQFDFLVEGLTPDVEPGGMSLQKRFFGNFGTLAKLGSATAPLSNAIASLGPVRAAMDRFIGVDARRDLPEFQRETLVDWFESRTPRAPNVTADRKVVLYADTYTNYIRVERGKAAVRTLEALGAHVELSTPRESGRAPLSQGMIETATENARAVADDVDPYLDAEFDVVVIEPSDLAAFRREYEKLLDEATHERLAENAYDVMEYVYGLLRNGADADALSGPTNPVAYHSHCQQRTLGVEAYTEAVLAELGYDVMTSDSECCGMAGSFGYKSEYYELAMDVGEDLREDFADAGDRTLVASGTSCAEQMSALFARDAVHPVELVAPDG